MINNNNNVTTNTTTTTSSPIVADTQSIESKLWWGEFRTMVNASKNPFATQTHHTIMEVVVEEDNVIGLQDDIKQIEKIIKNLLITVRNPIFERVPDKITEKDICF